MVAAASVVVALGTAAGLLTALGDGDDGDDPRGADRARPKVSATLLSPSTANPPSPSASPSVSAPTARPAPSPGRTARKPRAAAVTTGLYRHPESQVLDWVRANPADPRTAVIESRIAKPWRRCGSPSTPPTP